MSYCGRLSAWLGLHLLIEFERELKVFPCLFCSLEFDGETVTFLLRLLAFHQLKGKQVDAAGQLPDPLPKQPIDFGGRREL